MANKSTGKHYTSKGLIGVKNIKSERSEAQVLLDKRAAWAAGKKVILTVPNPNPNETRARFIKVNAREVWGDPKKVRAFEIK